MKVNQKQQMSRNIKTARFYRKASTTVEFAILLPILMTMALLCVDYGRFAHILIAVTNAARAGAAHGSVHTVPTYNKPTWDAAVKQIVADELATNSWFDPAQLVVPPPQITQEANGIQRISVEVQYPFDTFVNWPFLPGYNDTIILRRTVVLPLVR